MGVTPCGLETGLTRFLSGEDGQVGVSVAAVVIGSMSD